MAACTSAARRARMGYTLGAGVHGSSHPGTSVPPVGPFISLGVRDAFESIATFAVRRCLARKEDGELRADFRRYSCSDAPSPKRCATRDPMVVRVFSSAPIRTRMRRERWLGWQMETAEPAMRCNLRLLRFSPLGFAVDGSLRCPRHEAAAPPLTSRPEHSMQPGG